jgi:hypothetical protein
MRRIVVMNNEKSWFSHPGLFVLLGLWMCAAVCTAQGIDGTIDSGEYANRLEQAEGSYHLLWRIEGELIHMAISAETEGWVAVGLDPVVVMDNADMILGWVEEDQTVHVLDAHSLGPNGPFAADETRGGSDDILASAGAQQEGRTTVEFSRLLDTGDDLDAPIRSDGGNKIVWAYGASDDINRAYERFGQSYLRSDEVSRVRFLNAQSRPTFIVLLIVAFLLMATTLVIVRWSGGRRGWFLAHQITGWIAALLAGYASQAALFTPGSALRVAAIWGILFVATSAAYLILSAPLRRAVTRSRSLALLHRILGLLSLGILAAAVLIAIL